MTPSLRLASPVPTYVVALKDVGAFTSYQPRGPDGRRMDWVAGYFSPGPDANYLVAPWSGKDRESLAVMLHELTHHLASRNVGVIPTWVAEGVAEFYSTFRIDAGRNVAVVGEPPRDRVRSLIGKVLIPMDRFFAVTSTNEFANSPVELDLFYAQSWALVHYFFVGDQGARTRQIGTYLRALERGQDRSAAFTLAFGTTYDELGKQLVKYVRDLQFPVFRLKPSGPGGLTPDASRVSPMPEADAAALQAVLFARMGATADAEAALGRAMAQPPPSLQARIALDRVRRQLGQQADEAAQYEQLAALAAQAAAAKPLDALHPVLPVDGGARRRKGSGVRRGAGSRGAAESGRRHAPPACVRGVRARQRRGCRTRRPFLPPGPGPGLGDGVLRDLSRRARPAGACKQDDEAARLLAKAGTVVAAGTWTAKVLDYMQGKTAAAALLGERVERRRAHRGAHLHRLRRCAGRPARGGHRALPMGEGQGQPQLRRVSDRGGRAEAPRTAGTAVKRH